jgi:hypothetical protein
MLSHWEEPPNIDPTAELSSWIHFVKSLDGVCGYTKGDWPPLALSSRHNDSYWLILWLQERRQHSMNPTLFNREPGIEGGSNTEFVRWQLNHTLEDEQCSNPERFFVDIGANDGLLRLERINCEGVAIFNIIKWHSFRVLALKRTDPLEEPIPPGPSWIRDRPDTVRELLTRRWNRDPSAPPPDAPASSIVPGPSAEGPFDLPESSLPLPSTELISPKLRLDLSDPAVREEFQDAVRARTERGENSQSALIHAAKSMGAVEAPSRPERTKRKRADITPETGQSSWCAELVKLRDDIRRKGTAALRGGRLTTVNKLRLKDHEFRILLGTEPLDTRLVCDHLSKILVAEHNESELRRAIQNGLEFAAASKKAKAHFLKDQGGALKKMTRPPDPESVTPLGQQVDCVRDLGRRTHAFERARGWDPQSLGCLYVPDPAEQWSRGDMVCRWRSDLHSHPDPPPPKTAPQPPSIPLEFPRCWKESLAIDYIGWLCTAKPPLPEAASCRVTWPDRSVDFTGVAAELDELVREQIRDGSALLLPSGAVVCTTRRPNLLTALRLEGLVVDGEPVGKLVVSDGSGTPTSAGLKAPGGFGALSIVNESITVVVGGHSLTTSGAMELAGAFEGLSQSTAEGARGQVLAVSDYLAWVQARLGVYESTDFRGLSNADTWRSIIGVLRRWGGDLGDEDQDDNCLLRKHVKAHVETGGNWGQNLNEITDKLADLGKRLIADGTIRPWVCPTCPTTKTIQEIETELLGPTYPDEMRAALSYGSSNAQDTAGLSGGLLRSAGDPLVDRMVEEWNEAAYQGKMPTYTSDGSIVGRHKAIGKQGGGDRHLTIPDSLQAVFSTLDAKRIIRALIDLGAICKAQKCNIPKVAGVDENTFLFLATLYDFHAAAKYNLMSVGSVRIFLLSDISKAFDRAQVGPLLHAIKCIINVPGIERLLSRISHLYSVGKIAVTKGGITVLVDKLGGVFQGDPMSPVLFMILMEYVRRLLPPSLRPGIRFRSSIEGAKLRFEVDFADDQVRATDSVDEMRRLVSGLRKALDRVGLTWNPKKVKLLGLKYIGNGEIEVFDPLIDRGDGTCLQHLTKADVFKVLGITTNWRGDFFQAGSDAKTNEAAMIGRIGRSLYPIQAKLLAHRQVVANASQYLSFSAWLPPEIIDDMDRLERKSVRSFLGNINIPNAVIEGELKLSSRKWRQQVMHLAGWIRRLGSADARIQRAALLVTRDAGHYLGLIHEGRPLIKPRFFEFTERPDQSPEAGLLDTPVRYCSLAATWEVGVWEEDGKLVVTHKGNRLSSPHDLLQMLSKEAELLRLSLLEKRQSTNKEKPLAPPNAISWGVVGMVDKHRAESTRFLGPSSSFSDKEIQVLMSLRLLLWPTAFRNSIMSSGAKPGRCKCGSVQTATHLLLIPEKCTIHSLSLRSISQCRHSAGVRELARHILEDDYWKVASMEHVDEPDNHFETVRSSVSRARGRSELSLLSGRVQGSPKGAQHWKPDGILGRRVGNKTELLIIDVTFASDDKLVIEDEILHHWKANPPPKAKRPVLRSSFFDDNGRVTEEGLSTLPPELAEKAAKLEVFHPARYAKRYTPLVKSLRTDPTLTLTEKTRVLTIAIGVAGWIPDYTWKNMRRLVEREKDLLKITRSLRIAAQAYAVRAWRAFSEED